jgi:hypothetical protein
MQRQSRRTESARRCEQEDTDAGRAEQCSRTSDETGKPLINTVSL